MLSTGEQLSNPGGEARQRGRRLPASLGREETGPSPRQREEVGRAGEGEPGRSVYLQAGGVLSTSLTGNLPD